MIPKSGIHQCDDAREIGHLAPGGLRYIIMQTDDCGFHVESGNVRGFVRKSHLTTGDAASTSRNPERLRRIPLKSRLLPVRTKPCIIDFTCVTVLPPITASAPIFIQAAAQCLGKLLCLGRHIPHTRRCLLRFCTDPVLHKRIQDPQSSRCPVQIRDTDSRSAMPHLEI